jgi:hypothetical protein
MDYYVSAANGSDGGAGTLASPYKTIQQAASVVQAGDNVFIRGGTYRETVTVAHSGNASQPITFQPYQGEQVTVTGLDVVGSSWSPYSGSIYQTTVASGGASQLFVGGQMMTEARFPNAGYNNPLHAATLTTSSASSTDPLTLDTRVTIHGADLAGSPNSTWNGANVVINPNHDFREGYLSRPILDHTGDAVTYQVQHNEVGNPSLHIPVAGGGDSYYINQSLAALNASKEWYYDSDSHNLYLQAPGNVNPATLMVEARKRQYGFDLGNRSYVQIKGISLKAANLNVAGNNNLIDNCQVLYPIPYAAPTDWKGAAGVRISGQYNTISNSEVAYAWGDGVTITNSNNTIRNNVIHDVDWAGNQAAFVGTSQSGGYNTITGNTMYNAGRDGVALAHASEAAGPTPNSTVTHNDISRFGVLCNDLGGVYTFQTHGEGSVIAYNRITDTVGHSQSVGVYLDEATFGYMVHHNLIQGTAEGVRTSCNDHHVYNNTLQVGWRAVNTFGDVGGIYVYNNLSSMGYFAGDGGIAGTSVSNNLIQDADQFNDPARGDYTLKPNNGASMMAADYGISSAQYPTGPYQGAAPDAGAFESGETPWTAGASFRTWTAGNQRIAPLASAVTVTPNNVRTTTDSLTAGRLSTTSSSRRRAFIKFDLDDIPHVKITNAVLRLYENMAPDSANGTVSLYKVLSSWTDSTVSFSQSVSSSGTSFYDAANLDFYTDVDITSIVQAWLDNPSTNFGLSLRGSESTSYSAKYFDGFYGITAPLLLITLPEPSSLMLVAVAGAVFLGLRWGTRTSRTGPKTE